MAETIERVVTHGTFSLDGGTWEVDNNVWIIGDNKHVTIIDPAHNIDKIAKKVGERTVEKILLTHAHDDHIRSAKEAAERFKVPVYLNPEDRVLWDMVYPSWDFDESLHDGQKIRVGATELHVIATPEGVLFSGDTLFKGGPGATGRSYSDFDTIIGSIESKLLTLPESTAVLTGHGDSTGIGVEAPDLDAWKKRGH